MDDSDLKLIRYLLITAVMFLALPVSCTMYQTYQVGEAIKSGANPIDARCAMSNPNEHSRDTMCFIRATTKEGK